MIESLTGHLAFACGCRIIGECIVAGLLVLDLDFTPGKHELWDAEGNCYGIDIEGVPGSFEFNVSMRCLDASF